MNLFGLISLILGIGLLVYFFGMGAEQIQEDSSNDGVYQNTLDAAQNAADSMNK
jgi:hypothetical protein